MASSNNSLQLQIPRFNGKIYDFWSIQMKILFGSQDLWELVENGLTEPANAAAFNALSQAEKDLLKENRKKDQKALFYIMQGVEETIFPRIAAATKSKQACDILANSFQGTNKVKMVKLQMLRREFEGLQMHENETMSEFFTWTMGIINQIKMIGENIEEQRIVEKILRSLPPKYDPIVVAIEEAKDLSTISVDELMGSLQTHEQRLNRSSQPSLEQAFKAQLSFKKEEHQQVSSSFRGRGRRGQNYRGRATRGLGRGGRSNFTNKEGSNNNYSQSRGRGNNRYQQGDSNQRFISAPLDDADLQNLESQLVHSYQDLEFKALTILLDRLPIIPSPSQGEYPSDAVGLEEAQNEVTKLLDLTESSPKIVVIYGVGGIGKTTLATAVFNSLKLTDYHYCRIDMDKDCKLSDLQAMQEQILRNLFNENLKLNNCTEGRGKLSEAFGKASKPVFLFIDNALSHTDVEVLLPMQHLSDLPIKSRILLTTRSLEEAKIFSLHGIQVHSHRVDSLSEAEANRLLCHYALGDKDGSFDQGINIDGLLQICERIPLFLKIVGSKLRTSGNTVSACNEILEYIKEWQRTGLEGGDQNLGERMVDFVYQRLTEPSREAFLDIVFFFNDWKRSQVACIVGEMHLQDLEAAALVTTTEEYVADMGYKVKKRKVKMHDVVRARGRRLSEGNRITDSESLSSLLDDERKLRRTKGIWLRDDDDDMSVEAKHVELMRRSLRVLSFGEHTRLRIHGRCKRAFEELRFLAISHDDILTIQLNKSKRLSSLIVHLKRGAKFTIDLRESLRLQYLEARASDSSAILHINGHLSSVEELQLTNIPFENFETRKFSCLKTLTLYKSNLKRLPDGFENLFSLQKLYIQNCYKLETLPESFGNLSSLKELWMQNSSKLERLPESLGNLSSLQELYIKECSKLERIPESFGNLSYLNKLGMSDCSKLKTLPESFGNLSSLKELWMQNCSKLETLPESFGNLSSLQKLDMDDCSKLERLPKSFGNLSSLQILWMRNNSILERLPRSFGDLSSLKELWMQNCSKLKRLPESFGNLSYLQKLKMKNSSMLERLPESFGNLSSLKELWMQNCSKLDTLPESFGNLSSLQKLYMQNCSKLERLPQALYQLSCLQKLEIDGCKNMCSLSDNFGQLKCLKFLNIRNCKELKRLSDNVTCPTSLVAVKAYGCAELEAKALDSLVEIKSMMFLEVGESPMLIKRWEKIQQRRPLIGAALRFKRGEYPYGEIMSTMFFNSGSRILHVDGEGQLVEVASSSFPDVGVKVALVLSARSLSDELRHKLPEVASLKYQIIYVDVDVEGEGEAEGSGWMEEREERIRKRIVQLPEGSCAWTSPLHKSRLLFAYSLWHFAGSAVEKDQPAERAGDTWIVGTSVEEDEEGRRKLSHPSEMIFPTDGGSVGVELKSLFSPLSEACEWMV